MASRRGLALGAGASMALVSASTVAYAALAGPLLVGLFEGGPDGSLTGLFGGWPARWPGGVTAWLAATLLAVTVARAVAGYGQRMLSARLGQDAVRELRRDLHGHLLRIAPEALVEQRRGELASRLVGDVAQVQGLLSTNLVAAAAHVVTLAGLASLAFALDPVLAALTLSAVIPIAIVVARLAASTRRAQHRVWAQQGAVANRAAELADAVPLIRSYGAEPRAEAVFEEAIAELERRTLAAQRRQALTAPVVQLTAGAALAVALVAAGARLETGALAPGALASFFAAMFFVYRPLQGLGATIQQLAAGLGALDRVDEILALPLDPADPADARPLEPMRESLEVEGLRFAYGAQPVLDGLDLTIRAGETVALVGSSGAGKTTLLRILLGLLRADAGTLRLDGVPRERSTRESWRRQFAWVTQEPLLFADTVLHNVALADPAPDRERAREALARAGAEALVDRLGGLDARLAEGGRGLSGGQRQRLCLARALYRGAPVLVLDEATSDLDGPSERAVAETLEGLFGSRTVLLVSHRLRTVRRADRVLVLEGGRVVEAGPPARLWETEGRFRALFRDASAGE